VIVSLSIPTHAGVKSADFGANMRLPEYCATHSLKEFMEMMEDRGNYESRHPQDYLTNPAHGGKVTCYKCNGFIIEGEEIGYWDHQHKDEFPNAHFHKKCFNGYEHYYGLDKPID
jgi:hypothetical protein